LLRALYLNIWQHAAVAFDKADENVVMGGMHGFDTEIDFCYAHGRQSFDEEPFKISMPGMTISL